MRVNAGIMKGRKIFAPSGLALRPTPSKVREAFFNILSDRILESSFLDLYAGTGAMGIEALSRGAKFATFVEQDRRHLHYLKKNLTDCLLGEKSVVIGTTVDRFLKNIVASFDLIFLDPPYKSGEIERVLPRLNEGDIMAENGRLVIEHFYKKIPPETIGALHFLKKYRYGETILSFYGKQ